MTINAFLNPATLLGEKRVDNNIAQNTKHKHKQRVIDNSLIITIARLTDAPLIINTCNPIAKRLLHNIRWMHRQQMRKNSLGIIPVQPITDCVTVAPDTPVVIPPLRTQTGMPTQATPCLVTQHVLNTLTKSEDMALNTIFSLWSLLPDATAMA
jgi:hypothetical protein